MADPRVTASQRALVETLGVLGVSRQLAAGAASANTALTASCRRVSICATGAAIRYAVGSSEQTAEATSHYIGQNERLTILLPPTPNIAVLRISSNGVLEVTEFTDPQ